MGDSAKVAQRGDIEEGTKFTTLDQPELLWPASALRRPEDQASLALSCARRGHGWQNRRPGSLPTLRGSNRS